jgi:RNA polymerase sigma-70 factor (ECF subfamily)
LANGQRLLDVVRKEMANAWAYICAMVRPAEASAPAISRETSQRFQSTIVPHLDSAYNFARYLSRDPDAASDIVQDAFLRAYRGFDSFRGGDARAWVFAIVRNCHHAWHNQGRRKARYEVSMTTESDDDADHPVNRIAADTDTPEASTMRRSEQVRVRGVIAGLSEPMREVLVLRELEDFSYKQISEVLDIPVGTVMSRLARARVEFGEAWRTLEASEAPQ